MPVDQVAIGDRILVRPGQRIPVDGVVIKGLSTVNQAPVTGESVPVIKDVNDEVMAGTVNGEAALEIRTTKIAAEGTMEDLRKQTEAGDASLEDLFLKVTGGVAEKELARVLED